MAVRKSLLWLSFVILNLSSFLVAGEGPECPENTFNRAGFPKGFMFGTASSAFQYEGAPTKGCKGPSIWDHFIKKYPERNAGQTEKDIEALDFYHRYKEDIQLMKSLNMDSFRLSISWPRIFPHGRMIKGVSEEGVRFYDDLINELINNGITPLVTLFHWDLPQDLEDEYGGFLNERIVEDFREYANFTFNRYGDRVKHWITFNEPYIFSRAGYDSGKKAPGRCSKYMNPQCHEGKSGYEPYIVSHNLLLAHAEAVAELRKCSVCKNGKIGISHAPAWFEPHDSEEPNAQKAIQRALDFILGWHMHPTKYGDYPDNMKELLKDRLPTFTDAQKAKLKNSYDFVGINYYSSAFVAHNDSHDTTKPHWMADSQVSWKPKNKLGQSLAPQAALGKLPVYPEGLRRLMNYLKDKYENPEILITENGYGEDFDDKITLEEGLKDYSRKNYHIRHLVSLRKAICEDKVNVTGYFVWSLLDNIEWQEGRAARFGLYYIDFKNNLTRHAKESTKWFTEFLKRDATKKDEL